MVGAYSPRAHLNECLAAQRMIKSLTALMRDRRDPAGSGNAPPDLLELPLKPVITR